MRVFKKELLSKILTCVLISDISLLSSTDRIEKIATEELGMHKAETSDIVRVQMAGEK